MDTSDRGKLIQEALEAPMPKRSIEEWVEDVGGGWGPLIRGLDANLRALDPDYRIGQIKEKFGGLRYYVDSFSGDTELADKLVRAAEDVSFKICEDCGGPGDRSSTNKGFWIKTLCPRCAAYRRDDQEFKGMVESGDYEIVSDDPAE
jgi:hypothetical protein